MTSPYHPATTVAKSMLTLPVLDDLGYPDTQIDMVYVHPPLASVRMDGRLPRRSRKTGLTVRHSGSAGVDTGLRRTPGGRELTTLHPFRSR